MSAYEDEGSLWYPSIDDVLLVHEDILQEDENATQGVTDPDRIQFAISYVQGRLGEGPETIHEKAFHLMRLIASNHWFADGNKRTALNTTELFYALNGYELDYGEDLRSMLKLFSVRESLIDRTAGPKYFEDRATLIEVEDTDPWNAIRAAILGTIVEWSDADPDGLLPDDHEPALRRSEWGLTTEYDGTVNSDDERSSTNDGG